MKITIGGHNNIYTSVFDATAKTLTISGVQGFDLTDAMLDSVYDSTTSAFIPCKRVTCTYSYVAGLPVYVYTFYSLPAGVASSDTLVISLDIPSAFAAISIQQYQASKI